METSALEALVAIRLRNNRSQCELRAYAYYLATARAKRAHYLGEGRSNRFILGAPLYYPTMASTSRAKRTSMAVVPVPVAANNEEVRCALHFTLAMTKKLMAAFLPRTLANLAARGLVTVEEIHAEVEQLFDQATAITFTYSEEHARDLLLHTRTTLQSGIMLESVDLIAMGCFVVKAFEMFKHRIL